MLEARIHAALDEIAPAAWDALVPDDHPFVRHAFLAGLERHGCIRADLGWQPFHLALYEGERLAAAAPLYLKGNSHGEYVFDWTWARAYARAGRDYYPKLLAAVPYSPVTGPRLLVGSGDGAAARRAALVEVLRRLVEERGLSSAHANFLTDADAGTFEDGWLARSDWQFHWHNRGYRDFADFADALNHKKRKNLRHERAQVTLAGIEVELRDGHEMDERAWAEMHALYVDTFDAKGNLAALTEAFFRHLGATMPTQVLVAFGRRGGRIVAGALLLRGADTLYGRYWGAREHVPGLHFELCYYQGIDYCIRHGLARFEPGAQGEHKLARGFLPVRTHSRHYIRDPRFRAAIREALAQEAEAVEAYGRELMEHSPYAQR
ncbi:MAG TPA: GNAT family N-acetyltransferase [Mizugakiibacter sp.]